MKQPFSKMDDDSRVFYSRVFTEAMLNIHAVQMGVFPLYISEMSSPFHFALWRAAVPELRGEIIKKLKEQRDGV